MIFLITDTHLGHDNMVWLCNRPENFTELIIENWKKVVTDRDTVIHLGDVAWNDENLMRLLNLPGRKLLVRGNHDKRRDIEYLKLGFDFVCENMTFDFDNLRVLFSHKPNYFHTADINFHGHFHDLHREDFSKLYLPFSLEHMGYKPIALNKEFLKVVRAWVTKRHIPSLEEIMELRQNHIGTPRERDLYGSFDINKSEPELYEGVVKRRAEFLTIINTPEFASLKNNPNIDDIFERFVGGAIGEVGLKHRLGEELEKNRLK